MEVKNDLSKKVQQKVYTFNDNYWLFFEGEEYKNESDDIKQEKYEEYLIKEEKKRIIQIQREKRAEKEDNIELKERLGSLGDFETTKKVFAAVKSEFYLRENPIRWTRFIIETKDICYNWENEDELKDFDDFRQQYHDCQEIKEEIFKKSENIVVEPVVEEKEPEPVETTELSEVVEAPPQASKPIVDTLAPIKENIEPVAAEEPVIEDRYRPKIETGLEIDEITFDKIGNIAKFVIDGLNSTRKRKIGKKKIWLYNHAVLLILGNAFKYSDCWIPIEMGISAHEIKRDGGTRSSNQEIQVLEILEAKKAIEIKKGVGWKEAKSKNTNITTYRIKQDFYDRHSEIKNGIKERYKISSLSIFGRDTLQDIRVNGKKITPKPDEIDIEKNLDMFSDTGIKNYYQKKNVIEKYNKVVDNAVIVFNNKIIHQDQKRIHAVLGITKNLNEKGRFFSSLTNVKKDQRKKIMINGNPVIELDFSCCFLGIAYHLQGVDVKKEDLYQINGFSSEYRQTIKNITNITLNFSTFKPLHATLSTQMNDFRANAKAETVKAKKENREPDFRYLKGIYCPPNTENIPNIGIISAVTTKLRKSPIAGLLFQGYRENYLGHKVSDAPGNRLMYHESNIAQKIINHFAEQNIVCLCVHDSYLVETQHREELRNSMVRFYKEETGFDPIGIT